jgi:hypothetical protein
MLTIQSRWPNIISQFSTATLGTLSLAPYGQSKSILIELSHVYVTKLSK